MSNYEHAARLADQQADAQAYALLAVADAIREQQTVTPVYRAI